MLTLIAQAGQTIDIASQTDKITKISDLGGLVGIGASAILTIGGLAFLMYLLLGGFHWITAGGDKGKVETARNMITQGIIGLAILASVFALYSVVLRYFGLKSIQIGPRGGQTTSTTSGGGGGGGCTVGQTSSDGGSGGYCNGGAAQVKCFGPGQGYSKFNYNHYEPCSCLSGSENSAYNFDSC